jgi:hypothetical protein
MGKTKIVYLIASHKNPEQVYQLVKTIKNGSPNSTVVLHHDYHSTYLDVNLFSDFKFVHIIQSHEPMMWGDFSLVQMTLNSINWLVNNLTFDWLVFISGQDFPIRPLREIELFLENTEYDGFIRGVSLEDAVPCGPVECEIDGQNGKRCRNCFERYYYQYYLLPEFCQRHLVDPGILKRLFGKFLSGFHSIQSSIRFTVLPFYGSRKLKIGIRSSLLPSNIKLTLYKGSQWFTLNRKCVDYIHEYSANHPAVVAYFKRTIIPDETFFHTILYNCPHLKLCSNNQRYISWKNLSVPSPEILTLSDYNKIVSSNKHFARKFESKVDSTILVALEKLISPES